MRCQSFHCAALRRATATVPRPCVIGLPNRIETFFLPESECSTVTLFTAAHESNRSYVDVLVECGEWLVSVQTDKLAVRSSLLLLLLHRLAKAEREFSYCSYHTLTR